MNDGEKAAFILIGSVIALYAVVIFAQVGMCIYHSQAIADGRVACDANNKLIELLAAALAAALAFANSVKR